jgi:hypothetical protein
MKRRAQMNRRLRVRSASQTVPGGTTRGVSPSPLLHVGGVLRHGDETRHPRDARRAPEGSSAWIRGALRISIAEAAGLAVPSN